MKIRSWWSRTKAGDERKLRENLEILKGICNDTGCRILLAQKVFSMYRVYPLIGEYLNGTTASGLYEAQLGYEEMRKENHIFSPAYKEDELPEIHIPAGRPYMSCRRCNQRLCI